MPTIVCFDIDGMLIHAKRFSDRLVERQGISMDAVLPFFKGEFKQCMLGKADLKVALTPYLTAWKWTGTVEELMDYWFSGERNVDQPMVELARQLRAAGVVCCLTTNQEQYRLTYLMHDADLAKDFDGVAASFKFGATKKEPEFWRQAQATFGETTKSNIHVWDDDPENVAAARAYGLDAHQFTSFDEFNEAMQSYLRG